MKMFRLVSPVSIVSVLAWWALACAVVVPSQAGVVITEFMADNETTLRDDFGAFSDWIEIYNDGSETVNLAGYSLTDSLAQPTLWRFPATNLPPRRFLLVFASGADRRLPGAPLHTNFKLSADGESLALVHADGKTVLTHFSFGTQPAGFSFGVEMETPNERSMLPDGAGCRTFVPTLDIGSGWLSPGFNDSSWLASSPSIGFELVAPALGSLREFIGTDLRMPMYDNRRPGAYLRIPFTVQDPNSVGELRLAMRYDDGFVAYLNGQEVARRNAPADVKFGSVATTNRANALAVVAESLLPIPALSSLLKPGVNLLAIQGLNRAASDTDFLISPQLTASDIVVAGERRRAFAIPTPGGVNAGGLTGTAGEVSFSHPSGTFSDPFVLRLAPARAEVVGEIRFTLDRSEPTESSSLYTGPLTVTNTAYLRARLFEPAKYAGPVATGSYLFLSANTTNFSSDLPVLVLHTLGGGTIGDSKATVCHLEIHDTFQGRSSLLRAADLLTRATAKQRGSSTGANAKKAMAIEFQDEQGDARDLSPLGMPAESDWVLYAVNDQEPVLIHNPYAYDLGRRMGRYAPDTRFVEVFLNETGGAITASHYFGLYVLVEKIKIGPDRVDISRLEPADLKEPELTGGYLFKFDRRDPGDNGFAVLGLSAGEGALGPCYVEPKESDIKLVERDAQEKYLLNYFREVDAAVSGPNFKDPVNGYAKYIDVEAAVDFHLLNTLTFSVDGEVLSTFFHKPRQGKITFGPPWDFDRSMGSLDAGYARDQSPLVWATQGYFFGLSWWGRLFNDPNFWQRYIDRYQELRRGVFSTDELLRRVDFFVDQVREAQNREVARWPSFTKPRNTLLTAAGGYTFDFRNAGYQGEVDQMKHWLSERVRFMDSNFVDPPSFSASGGVILSGFRLSMTGAASSTIYYTLDGTDPRLSGGALNPKALVYSSPIVLDRNVRLFARCRDLTWRSITGGNNPPLSSPWSGSVVETYMVSSPSLSVSELMYHPAAPGPGSSYTREDFEFIEFRNTGDAALSLRGFSIRGEAVFLNRSRPAPGIRFSFPEMTLGAGEHVLVVANRAAFESRYGNSLRVAGEFSGHLKQAEDRVIVEGPLREPIADFRISNSWYPITDGYGFSLVLREEAMLEPQQLGRRESWWYSARAGGSPGEAEPLRPLVPEVVVNEVVAHTELPTLDQIELYNPGTTVADIGGWYLTDDEKIPEKYVIPVGTKVEPGGYVVFTERDFNSTPGVGTSFALSSRGDEVYLFSAAVSGELTGYRDGFRFGGSEPGVSFGRHLLAGGLQSPAKAYPPMSANTFGSANAVPRSGAVVINEIMYHPPDLLVNGDYWDDSQEEFIELQNLTDSAVKLYDESYPTNTWRLVTSRIFRFPTNVVVPANGFVLLVNFDPIKDSRRLVAFKIRHAVGDDTPVIGPLPGKLDNSSEHLSLTKPGRPGESDLADVPWIVVDEVQYSDALDWPPGGDGIGLSLQRVGRGGYGNDPSQWIASMPTPGRVNAQRGTSPALSRHPESLSVVAGQNATFVVQAAGSGTLRYAWFFNGSVLNGRNDPALVLEKVSLSEAGDYTAMVFDEGGVSVSETAHLMVREPAQILIPPARQTVNAGTNVAFRVEAKGQGILRYQWQFNQQSLPGATQATLTLSKVSLRDSGEYRVIVSDDVGPAISPAATLTVMVRPVVTLQPQPIIAAVGSSVTFTFAAYGTPPLSYVWRKNNDLLGTAQSTPDPAMLVTLTIPQVQFSHAGLYGVRYGSPALTQGFSDFARLTVLADTDGDGIPDDWEMTHQLVAGDGADGDHDDDHDGFTNREEYEADTDPHSSLSRLSIQSISMAGGRAQITFNASANRTYSLQLSRDVGHEEWVTLTNSPSRGEARLEIIQDPFPASTARWYRLVTPSQPRLESGPLLIAYPRAASVVAGAEAGFEVVAAGRGDLTYQWLLNGVPIPGETTARLRIPSAQVADEGSYSVLVQDSLGRATSPAALLKVVSGKSGEGL